MNNSTVDAFCTKQHMMSQKKYPFNMKRHALPVEEYITCSLQVGAESIQTETDTKKEPKGH